MQVLVEVDLQEGCSHTLMMGCGILNCSQVVTCCCVYLCLASSLLQASERQPPLVSVA